MSDIGVMLPQPPFVAGGAWRFDPTCWCAALSSWQAVTNGRKQESKEDLEAKMVRAGAMTVTAKGQPTLDAGKFDVLARTPNIELGWKAVRGADLFGKWNLEMCLEVYGYVYLVMLLGRSEYAGGTISHARVMFGAWDAMKVAYFMDPAANRVVDDYKTLVGGRFLVGVARERLMSLDDGWINEKPGA